MKRNRLLVLHAIMALTTAISVSVYGSDCSDYPYADGINVEDVAGGTKILATASVSVSLDDVDAVQDARDEATMEAKSLISRFMKEDISNDDIVERVVKESKFSTAEGKSVSREELVTRVKTLRNSSSALLRGAVTLGDCYTPGRELRVSVGIKPETIRSAERLSGSVSGSGDQGPSEATTGDDGLRNVDGYSNTKALENF